MSVEAGDNFRLRHYPRPTLLRPPRDRRLAVAFPSAVDVRIRSLSLRPFSHPDSGLVVPAVSALKLFELPAVYNPVSVCIPWGRREKGIWLIEITRISRWRPLRLVCPGIWNLCPNWADNDGCGNRDADQKTSHMGCPFVLSHDGIVSRTGSCARRVIDTQSEALATFHRWADTRQRRSWHLSRSLPATVSAACCCGSAEG